MAKTSINVAVTGDAKNFARELKKAEKDVGKFEKGASKAFGALKTAGIGVAAGLAGAFVKAGLDFEKMENVLIKGTGASGEALEDLKNQATDVLRTVPESAEVVAGAIADVNTFFGQTGEQLEDTTGLFLDFARVTDMDVGAAIARVDAQMTQFGVGLEDTDELLGDLVRVSQATGAPMDNLLSQMEKFGPLFSTANFSAEETVAIFGQLERAGVDVTKIGPSLTKFFADTAEAGEDPRAAFEAVVEQIQNATSETDALAVASDAFGTAGARMTSAIREGNLELETFGGLLGDGTGLVDAQADATETLSDKFAILKNDLMARLGPAAVATMEGIVVAIDAVIVAVEHVVAAVQEAARWIAEDLYPAIKPAIDLVVGYFQFLWEQIKAVVDLIIALFTGDFGGVWDAIKDLGSNMVTAFKDIGGEVGRGLINGLIAIWNMADLTFPRIEVPGWVPGIGGKGFGGFDVFPDIPYLAQGGIVTAPTLAVIGEAGPEAIVPLDRAGGMGGPTVNVTVQGSVISNYELADLIQAELVRTRYRNHDLEFSS